MKKSTTSSQQPIVGDSEGSLHIGPHANGPTPTIGDVVKGIKQQALALCQIGLAVYEPEGGSEHFQKRLEFAVALCSVANDLEALG